jgi:hypothetical protein
LYRGISLVLAVFAVTGIYLRSGEPASMQQADHCGADFSRGEVKSPPLKRPIGIVAPLSPAAFKTYTGTLTGTAENPPNGSPGTGSVTVTVNTVTNTMRVQATFSGLTGTTTASHIHCCAVAPANAGVATTTPSFVGFPLGVTSGTFDNTFDMTQASSYNPAYVTANGGTPAGAMAALFAGMDSTQSYFNVHSSTFGGGEIRAQLTLIGTTAAGVSISGRVLSAEGRGVRNAVVMITDQKGEARGVQTGPRGQFLIEDVATGQTYVISVNSRRFQFEPRVLTVTDDLSDIDFVASQ